MRFTIIFILSLCYESQLSGAYTYVENHHEEYYEELATSSQKRIETYSSSTSHLDPGNQRSHSTSSRKNRVETSWTSHSNKKPQVRNQSTGFRKTTGGSYGHSYRESYQTKNEHRAPTQNAGKHFGSSLHTSPILGSHHAEHHLGPSFNFEPQHFPFPDVFHQSLPNVHNDNGQSRSHHKFPKQSKNSHRTLHQQRHSNDFFSTSRHNNGAHNQFRIPNQQGPVTNYGTRLIPNIRNNISGKNNYQDFTHLGSRQRNNNRTPPFHGGHQDIHNPSLGLPSFGHERAYGVSKTLQGQNTFGRSKELSYMKAYGTGLENGSAIGEIKRTFSDLLKGI